jgi:hypothetical protein
MKLSTKAVLFSAVVCPGAGYWVLKYYFRAIVLFSVVLLALSVLMTHVLQQARILADKIANGDIPLDPQFISSKVHEIASGDGSLLLNGAAWTLLACWIIGIVDAYRLGTLHDSKSAP